MFKVECESCKAPYQIDERRVPPAGLKMRCPKCGHSFLVASPGGQPPAPSPSPAVSANAMADLPARPAPSGPGAARLAGSGSAGLGAALPARPAFSRAANRTIMGIAPPDAPAPPKAAPAPAPSLSRGDSLPSDFPAALGSFDGPDLPVVSPDLPARPAKPAPPALKPGPPPKPAGLPLGVGPRAAPPTAGAPIELELPVAAKAADLPTLPTIKARTAAAGAPPAKAANQASVAERPQVGPSAALVDLPAVAAGLPARPSSAPALPVVTASLPAAAAGLPSRSASLPVPLDSLPVRGGLGGRDLPAHADSLPALTPPERHLPVAAPVADLGAFGEIDLPREQPPSSRSPLPAAPPFGSMDAPDSPRGARGRASSSPPSSRAEGGMSFGEVDFGGADAHADVGVEAPPASPPPAAPATGPTSWAPPPPEPDASPTAGVEPGPQARPVARTAVRDLSPGRAAKKKRGAGGAVGLGLGLVVVVGGAALQLTPYGAYGYLGITDMVRAGDYTRATIAAVHDTQTALGADTYDVARAAVDGALAAHARTPRARPLTAYAAFVDYATTVRFGADPARVSRAKELLADLPPEGPVRYREIAIVAQSAAAGDVDGARKALEAAGPRDDDPVRLDATVLRGELALAASDAPAAVAAFKQAVALSNDARSHYGLARAYGLAGSAVEERKEIDATLVASPMHPGALVLRARRATDPTEALADAAKLIDGPPRAKASPRELSSAYSTRAWVELQHGASTAARAAFDQAIKLDASNVDALNGQGRLFLNESRNAEALARFDTALKLAPSSPATIANDAEAKIALERLEDAKQQLVAARSRFPKSIPILLGLGMVEQHLGNNDAAEADLRAAIANADPAVPEAVTAYVALSSLQSARGRLADARTTLDDAKKTRPPAGALELAFGQVNELQGDFEGAIAHYRAAVAKDAKDIAAHFRLAVALRRVRRFDEAGAELDKVAAVDHDYPGLLLERGLLFEDAGDVEKAIEQFKTALAKAPDDPDLQLRVGAAYVAIGRPDDALPMLRKVLEKRPTSAEANHYIGRGLKLKGGSLEADALHYLKRAVELDPNRAEFHVYLAWAANDATPAQLELARDEIDKALALDKVNAEAYWQRGVLERMEGAVEDAIKDEKRALELRPSRYEAHATLAQCYEDKNEDALALAEWPKAIAGDAASPSGEATTHPFWRYRYGKLLAEKGNRAAALAQLLPAVGAGERMEVRPAWLAPLEFLVAEALRATGKRAEAIDHYKRFLDIAPVSSPDRYDAQKALDGLGAH